LIVGRLLRKSGHAMKCVILAGGYGTRLAEESVVRPKPMVEIGGRPILWHIMKIYSAHGINEFVVCLGYKGYMIKEYFANYFLHMSDVTFDMANNEMTVHEKHAEPWKVTLVETGEDSMTGGRIKRIAPYVQNDENFCMTYGDGVANVDIPALIDFHRQSGKRATLTAIQPTGRFGALDLDANHHVTHFLEKPLGDGGWINGGFFVLQPTVLDEIKGDATNFEADILPSLATQGEVLAYKHTGFWHSMDTLRDKTHLQALWDTGNAPWKVW
jgi:glucose-1-phosphate cytidylyltransferase